MVAQLVGKFGNSAGVGISRHRHMPATPVPPAFTSCVQAAIARWDVLATILAHGCGGDDAQEKRDWLPSVICDLFAAEGRLALS